MPGESISRLRGTEILGIPIAACASDFLQFASQEFGDQLFVQSTWQHGKPERDGSVAERARRLPPAPRAGKGSDWLSSKAATSRLT
jgi:hypothetical protein